MTGPGVARIAVTGASGFVGSRLCEWLVSHGHAVCAFSRLAGSSFPLTPNMECRQVSGLSSDSEWIRNFEGVDCVVHLAGMVHEFGNEELTAFREVNVQGTRNLLECAIKQGVQRFIFISTIKVNGENSIPAEPITAESPVNPRGAYAQSKWEAEQVVAEVGSSSGIEIVIIRPVLVYGPKVRANFLRLMSLIRSGLPLPLGAVNNLRSILYIDNLCDLVELCTRHKKAGNEIFLAADATPISTPDLIRFIANAMNRSPHLFSIPPIILEGVSAIVNRGSKVRRLTGSLVASIDKNEAVLDWAPPVTTQEGLARTVKSFVQQAENG